MKNTTQGGRVERQIQHETKPSAVFVLRHPLSAVFFIHMSLGSALTVIWHFEPSRIQSLQSNGS